MRKPNGDSAFPAGLLYGRGSTGGRIATFSENGCRNAAEKAHEGTIWAM